MPRNILCFIICTLLCLMLSGCSDESNSESEDFTPSITTTLGENPTIMLEVGEIQTVCFRIVTDEPVFKDDFSVSLSDTQIADVEYLKISGEYVYYRIKAKAQGGLNLFVEIPALELKSETVRVNVTAAVPDSIYTSLGEDPAISVTEESSKTVCFRVGENISPEALDPVINDESVAKVSFKQRSGEYFYYEITGLSKGSTMFYLEMTELGVCSETVKVNVIKKGSSSVPGEVISYIGNSNTKIFHLPACPYVNSIRSENRVEFGPEVERQDIIDQDYKSCGHCNP